MKLRKTIYYFCIIFLIFCILALSILIGFKHYNHHEFGLLLGNKTDESIAINSEYDDTFTNDMMNASYLKKMIEMDASKIKGNKIIKLSSLIKKSTYIIVNVGCNDICVNIKFDEYQNKLIFDEEILNRQVNITLSILDSIVTLLKNTNNKTTIYLASQKYPYTTFYKEINDVFTILNDGIKNISENKSIQFIQ